MIKERHTLEYFCRHCSNHKCKKKTLKTCKGFYPGFEGDLGFTVLMKEWREFKNANL